MDALRVTRNDVVQWDVGNWSAALEFWHLHGGVDQGGLECLEIGANQGGISAWLASFGNRVVCSDVRDTEMQAHPLIDRYGLSDRVRFQDIDATSIPYDSVFDVVAFKSVLGGIGYNGAIERQARAIKAMHRALKPGGKLLFAENLRGSSVHNFLRSKFVRWGNRWRYLTIDEMRDFLRDFSDVKFSTTGVLGTLGRSESQRRVLAAVDNAGLNAIVPASWHYIIFGVATK